MVLRSFRQWVPGSAWPRLRTAADQPSSPPRQPARWLRALCLLGLVSITAACKVSFNTDPKANTLPEVTAGTEEEQREIVKEARRYSKLIESGNYEAVWRDAGPLLRGMSDQTSFTAALKLLRSSFRLPKDRQVKGLGFTTQVDAGGPLGEYAVVEVAGSEGRLTTTQKFVMQREEGKWKIVGYFVTKRFGTEQKP